MNKRTNPTVAGLPVVLTPAQVRCYAAVLRLWDQGRPVSTRSLGRELGRNLTAVRDRLVILRRKGFVAWEDKQCGTIRPLWRLDVFWESAGKGVTR